MLKPMHDLTIQRYHKLPRYKVLRVKQDLYHPTFGSGFGKRLDTEKNMAYELARTQGFM